MRRKLFVVGFASAILVLVAAMGLDAKERKSRQGGNNTAPPSVASWTIETLASPIVRIRVLNRIAIDAQDPTIVHNNYEYASGSVVDESGLVLTVAHSVENRRNVPSSLQEVAVLAYGIRQWVPANVIAEDTKHDVCLLQVNTRAFRPRTVLQIAGTRKAPQVGSPLLVAGFPFDAGDSDFALTWTLGVATEQQDQLASFKPALASLTDEITTFSQQTQPGFSGGPIMNEKGEVIGIVRGALEVNGRWGGISYGSLVSRKMIDAMLTAPTALEQPATTDSSSGGPVNEASETATTQGESGNPP